MTRDERGIDLPSVNEFNEQEAHAGAFQWGKRSPHNCATFLGGFCKILGVLRTVTLNVKWKRRKGGSMRQKARCCSAHRCLCGYSAPGGRHACLYTCSPAPVTFAHNHIPSDCLSRQCSGVQHCAHYSYYCHESFTTCSVCGCCFGNLDAYFTCVWLDGPASALVRNRTGTGGMEAAHAIHTAMQPTLNALLGKR